tara:strand:- start:561 stop:1208 length:648 start_codon:yes stop_codon:yes gene_type:complete
MAKVGYVGNTPDQTSVIVARQFVNVETDGVGVVTFNSGYTPGYLDVYLNGVKLQDATDFSAADGNTVNLTTTATTGDVLELVAFKALTLGASNIGITSAGTSIVSSGVQTLNFVGAGNTFLLRGNTVDISIEGGGAIGVSSNTFDSLTGAGFTHFNFIGAAVTALGTGDVGGAKTAVVTVNKTFTIGTRTGVANLNVTSGIATIALRTGVGTIRF